MVMRSLLLLVLCCVIPVDDRSYDQPTTAPIQGRQFCDYVGRGMLNFHPGDLVVGPILYTRTYWRVTGLEPGEEEMYTVGTHMVYECQTTPWGTKGLVLVGWLRTTNYYREVDDPQAYAEQMGYRRGELTDDEIDEMRSTGDMAGPFYEEIPPDGWMCEWRLHHDPKRKKHVCVGVPTATQQLKEAVRQWRKKAKPRPEPSTSS